MREPTARGRRRPRAFSLFITPVVILWAVPLAVFLAAVPFASRTEMSAVQGNERSAIAVVGSRTQDLRQGVQITFSMGAEPTVSLKAPGTLTSIAVAPGDTIDEADRLATVNDMPIFAGVGGSPIFRDARTGMKGPDIKSISRFLAAKGYLTKDQIDDRFGPRIRGGVERFQQALGLAQTGVFPASAVAYVPTKHSTVKSVMQQVGAAVTANASLLQVEGAPKSVSITALTQGQSLAALRGQSLKIVAGGGSGTALTSLNPHGGEVADLYAFLKTAEAKGLISPGGQKSTGASPNSQTDNSTVAFSGALVMLKNPRTVATVSAPAIFTAASGVHCIFETRKSSENARALAVPKAAEMPGEVGIVALRAGLAGKHVLADASSSSKAAKKQCK